LWVRTDEIGINALVLQTLQKRKDVFQLVISLDLDVFALKAVELDEDILMSFFNQLPEH